MLRTPVAPTQFVGDLPEVWAYRCRVCCVMFAREVNELLGDCPVCRAKKSYDPVAVDWERRRFVIVL